MKKFLSILLVLCVTLLVSACNDVVDNQENEVLNEFALKIDLANVMSITLQYENYGQYHLTSEESARFIETYSQSVLLQESDGEYGAEKCSVVIHKTNGSYVLLDLYGNADFDFTYSEYADNKFTEKHQIQNASLTRYVEELINTNFSIES